MSHVAESILCQLKEGPSQDTCRHGRHCSLPGSPATSARSHAASEIRSLLVPRAVSVVGDFREHLRRFV